MNGVNSSILNLFISGRKEQTLRWMQYSTSGKIVVMVTFFNEENNKSDEQGKKEKNLTH